MDLLFYHLVISIIMATSIEQEIKDIKKRLDELYSLSNAILHVLIPEVEPDEDEILAIGSEDELVSEETLFKELKK